jgi:hypothetical protein
MRLSILQNAEYVDLQSTAPTRASSWCTVLRHEALREGMVVWGWPGGGGGMLCKRAKGARDANAETARSRGRCHLLPPSRPPVSDSRHGLAYGGGWVLRWHGSRVLGEGHLDSGHDMKKS